MYNPNTDLLFPPRSLPALLDLRGKVWQDLVTSVIETGPDSLELMAFLLMMARLNNCATCHAASYRAMNGCTVCARQSLRRSHATDEALTGVFQSTRMEVEQYLQKKTTSFSGGPFNRF